MVQQREPNNFLSDVTPTEVDRAANSTRKSRGNGGAPTDPESTYPTDNEEDVQNRLYLRNRRNRRRYGESSSSSSSSYSSSSSSNSKRSRSSSIRRRSASSEESLVSTSGGEESSLSDNDGSSVGNDGTENLSDLSWALRLYRDAASKGHAGASFALATHALQVGRLGRAFGRCSGPLRYTSLSFFARVVHLAHALPLLRQCLGTRAAGAGHERAACTGGEPLREGCGAWQPSEGKMGGFALAGRSLSLPAAQTRARFLVRPGSVRLLRLHAVAVAGAL